MVVMRNWSGTAEVRAFVSFGGQGRFLIVQVGQRNEFITKKAYQIERL